MADTDHDILIRLEAALDGYVAALKAHNDLEIHPGARKLLDALKDELAGAQVERARFIQVIEGLRSEVREIKDTTGPSGAVAKAITTLQLELRVAISDIQSIKDWQRPVNWFIGIVGASVIVGILGLLWALLTNGAELIIHR